jgi:H+/gluconate symporter-like permease
MPQFTSSLLGKWLPWFVLLVAIAKLAEMIWRKRTGRLERTGSFNWVIGAMAVAIVLAVIAVVYQLYYGK